MPPIVAFVGRSGSGKTVLLERLIPCIVERGIKVGTLKHHGHRGFDIDVEGKDSWRHHNAGSSHVMVASPDRIASYRDIDVEPDVNELVKEFDDVDLLLVEGFHNSGFPTIVIARAENPREASKPSTLDEINTIGVVTNIETLAADAAQRGMFYAGLDDIQEIANYIVETTGFRSESE